MEKDSLYRFFARQTDDQTTRRIRQWVEESDENRKEFIAERQFYDAAVILSAEEASSIKAKSSRLKNLMNIAAAVALMVVASGVALMWHRSTEASEVKMLTVSVPAGQRLNMTLADGTEVWLNSNTTLTYPGVFTGDSRNVAIDGEGYFTVHHDSDRPFVVSTPRGNVTATGTIFNVDAYSSAEEMTVSLVEGRVHVDGKRNRYLLEPGQAVTIGDGRMTLDGLDSQDLQWIDGIVSFGSMPLRDIVRRFEKYYGVTVDFNCPDSIAATQFTGKFYIDEGIEQALNVLRHDVPIAYSVDKDRRHVTITSN